MSNAPPPKNHIANLLARVPVIGHAGRFLAEERYIALTATGLSVLAAIVAAMVYFGPRVLIVVADGAALLMFLIILALTRET